MFATVIPETKTFGNESFSYIIPNNLRGLLSIGSIVHIPFGKRKIRGVVAGFEKDISTDYTLREIDRMEERMTLPPYYLDIARWVSKYYLCSLGEAIGLFLPPNITKPRATKEHSCKDTSDARNVILSAEQKNISDSLIKSLKNPQKPALLHGVTGSGKTEIYIKLVKETILEGKQAIILVPEIMHTPQMMERFEEVFQDKVTLMHSNLSKSDKFHCFSDFNSGRKPILIGPRSALLVPNSKIGLIIVDEEQEDSFKQEQSPRYHAVTLAETIANYSHALLILGSATPRIETYYKAKYGTYDLLTLKSRYRNSMPTTQVVDLKDEIKYGNFLSISRLLQEEIKTVLKNKRQVLLFLNRRGVSTFVSCRDCGHILLCPNCSIPLVYFVNDRTDYLSCHHCGFKKKMVSTCPNCNSLKIKYFGAGIDKVENELKALFSDARIAKIDSSTMNSRKDYNLFYKKLKNHEIDIVIGTQIIAKGLDIPKVDLVGVISADTGLNMPHYRASEKTFQIITQVSGRSGRRECEGRTIIQTYWPNSPVIIAAAKHDFEKFYGSELAERKNFLYPPFTKLIRIVAENKDKDKSLSDIKAITSDLSNLKISYIGPGPCFYHKLSNRYRYHVIIKTENLPNENISKLSIKHHNLIFDVDPTDLL